MIQRAGFVVVAPLLFGGVAQAGETAPVAPPPARIPTYTFTPIGTLPGYERAWVHDINDSGAVVGTAFRTVFRDVLYIERRAFFFTDGILTDLGTSEFSSEAEGINNLGFIVGNDRDQENFPYAFLFDGRQLIQVFDCCRAVDINDQNQVVVYIGGQSLLWEDGTITDLGTFDPLHPWTEAVAINNSRQVVGKSQVWWPVWPYFRNFAFLWENGIMTQLPVLIDGPSSAVAINDVAEIIGYSDGQHVIWRNGVVELLNEEPYNLVGGAVTLNNHGDMAGGANPPGDETPVYATVWRQGSTYNLNQLVPPGTTWHLEIVKAMNDRGDIAGEGFPPEYYPPLWWAKAFVLHPIDSDVNDDGQVFLSDYRQLHFCLGGPGESPTPSCGMLDLDHDGDVDFIDYRSLELAFLPSQP
jgi:probable HAF family extracellular repeat protein